MKFASRMQFMPMHTLIGGLQKGMIQYDTVMLHLFPFLSRTGCTLPRHASHMLFSPRFNVPTAGTFFLQQADAVDPQLCVAYGQTVHIMRACPGSYVSCY